jgi:guanylate kinase
MPAKISNSILLVISAPSGGGKTTVCQQLLAANPNLQRVVTCTTRAPRPGEKDGVDYQFLTAEDFLKRVQAGEFLEHATVYGNSYGTLKSDVLSKLRQGRDLLLAIDVQGVAAIRAKAAEVPELQRSLVTVFLTPPSLDILARRLSQRATDTEAVQRKRLSVARQEISQWVHYEYLVLSGSIAEDLRRMQIIIEAEKMRQFRSTPPITDS